MSGSAYGKGPYGKGKYSRAPGFNDAGIDVRQPAIVRLSADLVPITVTRLAPIDAYTRMRVSGTIIRVGMHVIDQPTTVQLFGETLWPKVAVPACVPWISVGQPASFTVGSNSAGAMFP